MTTLTGGSVTNFNGRMFQYFGGSIHGGNFFYDDDFNLKAQNDGGPNTNFRTDGNGRRVLSWLDGNINHVFYIFDGENLIGEIDRNGDPKVAYTWANGLTSERLIPTSESRYYEYGPQGETRQLTNSTGIITDTYNYTAYGLSVASTGTSYNNHRYAGRYGYYTHSVTGTMLAGRRWYSPWVTRWLTHDPIGYDGGVNLFEYVGGNPVRFVDPEGLDPTGAQIGKTIGTVIGGALGGTAGVIVTGVGAVGTGGVGIILGPTNVGVGVIGGGILGGIIGTSIGDTIGNACGTFMSKDVTLGQTTDNVGKIADATGLTPREVRKRLHGAKDRLPNATSTKNPDVVVDLTSHEIYPKAPGGLLGDSIGNILDDC